MKVFTLSFGLCFLLFSCGNQESPVSSQTDLGMTALIDFNTESDMTFEAGSETDLEADMITDAEVDREIDRLPDPWLAEQEQLEQEGEITLLMLEQRSGDAEAGWQYLRYGNFVATGIPAEILNILNLDFSDGNLLMREGDNANIGRGFNAFDAPNGVRVIGGITCIGCHSSYLEGELIVGLGNTFSDYTQDQNSALIPLIDNIVNTQFGADSLEAEAYLEFKRGSARVAPFVVAPFRGLNPAFRIEEAAASMRDPFTFEWLDEPSFEVPMGGYTSDVPPWWNVKKKAALYYNGMGRGDFAKMIMQTSVVAIANVEQAAQIHSNFDDLLAWIYQLEPPSYPREIDTESKDRGQTLFEANCARCHGTYDEDPDLETYPNLLVSLEVVGTDPHYASYPNQSPELSRWLNQGWYAQSNAEGEDRLQAYPLLGYVAPPLDGIWASAPYLHNGSVPNLKSLLNSRLRPSRWQRDFDSSRYDFEQIGWPYTVPNEGEQIGDPTVYDTQIEGYSKQGHLFADYLSDVERNDLLEYLKSL